MTRVSLDPGECHKALARTGGPVVLDLETTGLRRTDRVVSAGLLVGDVAYVLFARSLHVSVTNLSPAVFLDALRPLERADLTVIAHNALFDLGFLLREGVRVGGEVRDTLKILRLLDQDRGGDRDASARHRPRRDLTAPENAPMYLDYKLKHVAGQLLGLKMPHFPGQIELAPYETHAKYLACDLVGTRWLHDYLWPRLTDGQRKYYQELVAPLLPIMLEMTDVGVAADRAFIAKESGRLDSLMKRLTDEHERLYRVRLGMTQDELTRWLYRELRLPVLKQQRRGRKWVPSLDSKVLQQLESFAENARAVGSLQLIQQYRQAASLLVRLRSLDRYIDPRTVRIYSSFDDRQATGRLSSTNPNLQQLAKAKTIADEEFHSRNALRATDGYELAVFDIGQADIRVLAHAVESFGQRADVYQADVRRQRRELLGSVIGELYEKLREQGNARFVGQPTQEPAFDPKMATDLAADFLTPDDFYTTVATRFLRRKPADKAERNRYKEIILSIVNGLGAPSLAKKLDCDVKQAKKFLAEFETAYPKVAAFKKLMYWHIAWTGTTTTFMGRTRTITPHRWLVTEPRVEMLVSYRRGDKYWLDVAPLRPGRHVLTTYVHRAWDAQTNRLIYDAERGPLTTRPYRIFTAEKLQYELPLRNWGWRSIRRVRCRGEEADYEGFDATARAAFNFICQGGTADISKLMMLNSREVCKKFTARLLIQIHDELVFEVPQEHTGAFMKEMKAVLEQPPVTGFAVPIVVEPKRGFTFGSLRKVLPEEL